MSSRVLAKINIILLTLDYWFMDVGLFFIGLLMLVFLFKFLSLFFLWHGASVLSALLIYVNHIVMFRQYSARSD